MTWVSRYVGLPWAAGGRDRAGVDCWGLVRLVIQEQRGIVLPSFVAAYAPGDGETIAGLIEQNRSLGMEVPPGEERAFDLVHCRMPCAASGGTRLLPWHVGVVVESGRMLHVTAALGAAAVERYRDAPRLHHRILGFYRVAAG